MLCVRFESEAAGRSATEDLACLAMELRELHARTACLNEGALERPSYSFHHNG